MDVEAFNGHFVAAMLALTENKLHQAFDSYRALVDVVGSSGTASQSSAARESRRPGRPTPARSSQPVKESSDNVFKEVGNTKTVL